MKRLYLKVWNHGGDAADLRSGTLNIDEIAGFERAIIGGQPISFELACDDIWRYGSLPGTSHARHRGQVEFSGGSDKVHIFVRNNHSWNRVGVVDRQEILNTLSGEGLEILLMPEKRDSRKLCKRCEQIVRGANLEFRWYTSRS